MRFTLLIIFLFQIFTSVLNSQSLTSLILPFQNQVTTDNNIHFKWSSNFYAPESYQLQLSTDNSFSTVVIDSMFISNNQLNLPVSNATSQYYWRVRWNDGITANNWSEIGFFKHFDPIAIGGLSVWIDPNQGVLLNGTGIQQINDISGLNNNAYQTTASLQPTIVYNDSTINNKTLMKYDGLNDFLSINDHNSLDFVSQFSFFLLYQPIVIAVNKTFLSKWDYPTQGSWAWQTGYNVTDEMLYSPAAYLNEAAPSSVTTTNADLSLNPTFLNLEFNGNATIEKIKFFKNFNLVGSSLTGTTAFGSTLPNSTASIKIGRYGGSATRYMNGKIGEILLYDHLLAINDKKDVESYLRFKYSPPVSLGNDTLIASNQLCGSILLHPQKPFSSYLWSTGQTTKTIVASVPGVYWLQAVDFFGFVSRDTIKVYPPYEINTLPLNNILCIGDTITWTTNYPSSSFTYSWENNSNDSINEITSSGNYWLKVIDINGCFIQSDTINFSIDNYPQTASLGTDTSLCVDNLIALQAGAQETINYEWNGLTTSAQAPFWVVDTTGNYFVETTNVNGCVAQDTIHITIIGQAPLANFSFQNQCFGMLTQFNDASVGLPNDPVSTWQWDFGNGDEDGEENPNYTYPAPGVYSVQLYAESAGGCGAFHTEVLEIHQLPLASFTHSGNCQGQLVNFTNTSVDGNAPISTYLWNFDQAASGSANTSSLPNPSCSFINAGIYQVALQVSDTNGCMDSVNISVDIQASPNASFTVNNACEGANAVIQNNSTITNPLSLVNHYWLYGDGTFANNPSIAKQYDSYGNYTILLVETASNGCVDSTQQTITIHPNPQLAWEIGPACQFTFTEFTNTSTVPIGSVSSTDWLVNLQYPYSSSSATYPFLTQGIQYLNLSTTSDQGCISDTLILVNVAAPLQANFTVVPSDLVAGINSTFINNSIGGNSYLWELGDGVSSLEENVIHSYSNTEIGNTLSVSLQISNNLGCMDTLVQNYTIGAPHFDLALSNLFCQDIDSYWTIGCELKNQGSIAITQANLVASLLNGLPIMENWQGTLAPGESTIYVFQSHPAAYIGTQDNYISYVCVEGEGFNALNLLDEELANNTSCRNVENDGVILLPLYPNPGNAYLEVKVFVPQGQEFELGLYDIQGRIIYKYIENEVITDAVKLINIPTQELSSGSYLLRLSDAAGTQIRKWVKE